MKFFVHLQSIAFRRGIVALLLAQLLMVLAMAASPQLHQWVHHDAGDDGHECAVTLFSHSGCDTVAAVVIVAAFVAVVLGNAVQGHLVGVESLYQARSVLEHAPPSVS